MRTPPGIRLINPRRQGGDLVYDVTVTWWYRLALHARRLIRR